jgi:hypothetical protein
MQSFYSGSNNVFTIRTSHTGSSDLSLNLEDMLTLQTSSISPLDYTWNSEQQILQFSASFTASVGDEFRATITDSCNTIWSGTIQCYASQSINKSEYVNQNTTGSFISNQTANEYIILT